MYNPISTAFDIYRLLQSAAPLANVNVVFYRILRLQHIVDFSSVLTTARNGAYGRAVIVLEPIARALQKNVLMLDWIFPVICLECPSLNDIQQGGPLSSYQLCQKVADQLHNFSDTLYGTMNIDGEAIVDDNEFVFKDSSGNVNTISKKVQFHILGRNTQTQRAGQLGSSVSGNTVTINPGLPTASQIYYTLDGSFPASVGNPSAQLYTVPVTVSSGQLFRAVGYLANLNSSACLSIQF